MSDVTIRLVKSLIGCDKSQLACAKALGLKKIGDQSTVADNAANRGQIKKLYFLLEVK